MLDIWNNPMHPLELRLKVAIAEVESLRRQVANQQVLLDSRAKPLQQAMSENVELHKQLMESAQQTERLRGLVAQCFEQPLLACGPLLQEMDSILQESGVTS